MQAYRALRRAGRAVAQASFEDLKASPGPTIASLLSQCGVPLPDPNGLAAPLAKDSQAGTDGAQDRGTPARVLTAEELDELEEVICELDPTLEPGTRLG